MATTISKNSPKNQFRYQIDFKKATRECGSFVSGGAMTQEECMAIAMQEVRNFRSACTLRIFENKESYPKFNWQKVYEQNY